VAATGVPRSQDPPSRWTLQYLANFPVPDEPSLEEEDGGEEGGVAHSCGQNHWCPFPTCVGVKDTSGCLVATKNKRPQALSPDYRGTSLIRNTPLLGPYSRTIPRVVWWS